MINSNSEYFYVAFLLPGVSWSPGVCLRPTFYLFLWIVCSCLLPIIWVLIPSVFKITHIYVSTHKLICVDYLHTYGIHTHTHTLVFMRYFSFICDICCSFFSLVCHWLWCFVLCKAEFFNVYVVRLLLFRWHWIFESIKMPSLTITSIHRNSPIFFSPYSFKCTFWSHGMYSCVWYGYRSSLFFISKWLFPGYRSISVLVIWDATSVIFYIPIVSCLLLDF